MRSWIAYVCICLGVLLVACDAVPAQTFERTRRGRLCGSQLAEALAMVCYSIYYVPREQRAERLPILFRGNVNGWRESEIKSDNPFVQRQGTTGYPEGRPRLLPVQPGSQEYFQRKTRQGIVDECCRKSCSVEELRAYCGLQADNQIESE